MIRKLNVVAILYGWSLRKYARRRTTIRPDELEAALCANRRSRPRLVVFYTLGAHMLELAAGVALGVVTLILAAHAADAINHAFARVLDLVGWFLIALPLSIALGVLLWAILPERRAGGFLRHPERLWPPSIMTILFAVSIGLGLWLV